MDELQATDPLTRTEVLGADASSRVIRLFFRGRTVIRKEPLGSDAEARLAHETAILERLRGVDGVAQLLDTPRYPASIVLADAGGESLAELEKPFDSADLLELAIGLARAVAAMHARGVIHRGIRAGAAEVGPTPRPGCCTSRFATTESVEPTRPVTDCWSSTTG